MRGRCLAADRAVEDALSDEALEVLDRQVPPGDAGGDDDRAGAEDVASVQGDGARGCVDAGDRARDEHLGPEPLRLLMGAAAELLARDAGGEAEVVLDPRRRAGLPAGRLALDDDRAQALGGAVDGRGETGRSAADHDGVVLGVGGLRLQAEPVGHLSERRLDDRPAVGEADLRRRARPPA